MYIECRLSASPESCEYPPWPSLRVVVWPPEPSALKPVNTRLSHHDWGVSLDIPRIIALAWCQRTQEWCVAPLKPRGCPRGGDAAHAACAGQELLCSSRLLVLPALLQVSPTFLQVLPKREIPHLQHVKGSNHALIRPPDTASTFQDLSPPLQVLPNGAVPRTRHVKGSD